MKNYLVLRPGAKTIGETGESCRTELPITGKTLRSLMFDVGPLRSQWPVRSKPQSSVLQHTIGAGNGIL